MFASNDDSLQIKLIDFGFAKKFDQSKPMTMILGSPLFMAPELV